MLFWLKKEGISFEAKKEITKFLSLKFIFLSLRWNRTVSYAFRCTMAMMMGGPTRYKGEDKMSPLDVGHSLTLSFLMIIYLGTASTDEKKTDIFSSTLLAYIKPLIGINLVLWLSFWSLYWADYINCDFNKWRPAA